MEGSNTFRVSDTASTEKFLTENGIPFKVTIPSNQLNLYRL